MSIPLATTARFVSPKVCSRCKGTGFVGGPVVYAGVPGTCFKCGGEGRVEGDKATIAAAKAWVAARTTLGRAARTHSFEAHTGLSILEVREPARLVKAVDSFAAGDAQVLPALVAYFQEA